MSISLMKICDNQKMNQDCLHDMKDICCRIFSCYFWVAFDETMTNTNPCLSVRNPHLVSPIKWRSFAMLPKQHFHWGVLMTIGISKLRQIEKMAPLFSCQMHWICFQDDECIVFRYNCLCCFWFDVRFYTHQSLCRTECWKASICQYLNFPLVPHSISCFRIHNNKKNFVKIIQPSRFNIWFERCTCICTCATVP